MRLLGIGSNGNENGSEDDNDNTELEQESERCKNGQTNLASKGHVRRPRHGYAKEQSPGEDEKKERNVKRAWQMWGKMESVGEQE